MEVAAEKNVVSVAFPSISTGIYGYPIALAARVAVSTVRESLGTALSIREVVFCCFSPEDLQQYEIAISETAA
jgi:O-acetyl-ADP-ribose deacetylase (regulator of RNase III)